MPWSVVCGLSLSLLFLYSLPFAISLARAPCYCLNMDESPRKRRRIDDDDDDDEPEDNFHNDPDYVDEEGDGTASEGSLDMADDPKLLMDGSPKLTYYDASKDGLPHHAAFDHRFVHARSMLDNVLKKTKERLTESDNKYLHRLKMELDGIAEIPGLGCVRIALVGLPGTGKSSLVNSMLDCPKLADTGSSGSACTNVAVEFSGPLDGQTADFAAEVVFHDDGLRSFVADLVEDYRRSLPGHSADVEDDEESDDEGEAQDVSQFQVGAQADNAFKMLHGLFRTHPVLKDEEEFRSFLGFEEHDSEGVKGSSYVLEAAFPFIRSLIRSHCVEDAKTSKCLQASSAEEMNESLQQYTREFVKPGETQLWPVVKLVRIGIRNREILNYVTNAALPGWKDDNKLRGAATHEYLRHTDSVWIVTPIQRVMSLKDIHDTITTFDVRMQGRIALVCTFVDDHANDDMPAEIKRKSGDDSVLHLKAKMDDEISAIKNYEDQQIIWKLAKNQPEMREKARLSLKHAREERRKAKYASKLALINMRVRFVQKEMRRKFPALKVFGISNALYQKLCFDHPTKHYHRLEAKDTGIDELRRFSKQLPGERFWNATRTFFHGPVKDFRDSVTIFVQGTDSKNRSEWVDKFLVPVEAMHKIVEDHFDGNMHAFQVEIANAIVKKKQKHKQCALDASRKWEVKPFTLRMYNEFARNNGIWGNKKVERQSWNEQLMDSVKKDLKSHWKTLRNRQEDKCDNLINALSAQLMSSMPIEKTKDRKPHFIQQFQDLVSRQSQTLHSFVYEDFDSFRQGIGHINWQIQGIGTDSYVVWRMEDAYKAIAEEHGKGMKQRMHVIMRAELKANTFSFVDSIAERASQDFKKLCEKHKKAMHVLVDDIAAKLDINFKNMMEELPPDKQLDELRESLVIFNENILKPKMDKVDDILRQLQRQYNTSSQ